MHPPKVVLAFYLPVIVCSPLPKEKGMRSPVLLHLTAQQTWYEAQPIAKDIAGLSIEFCYITDYLGDVSSPNKLSLQLLQNVQDIIGSPPIIRIGGHTQDAASYCASCLQTLNNTFAAGNDEAIAVNFNRNLFEVLNSNVPSRQKIIFGLNFAGNDVSIPLAEVEAAETYTDPNRLLAYELGNEPDFYNVQRPGVWNVETFADQQEQWFSKLSLKTKKGFVIGSLAQEPQWMGNFSLVGLNSLGMAKKVDYPVAYSDHTYPYSLCDAERAALVSLPNLMNHTALVEYFAQWTPEINAARDAGVPFIMGETGSVSCHGASGVSNTLGAALWELDYMLHGSTMGMSGVYFHMGTPFFYSMWQPVEHKGTPARVYPTYYSLLFMAQALSVTDPYILPLTTVTQEPDLALYGIYSKAPSADSKPEKVIIVNLAYLPANSTSIVKPSKSVDVSTMFKKRVNVIRLSAPGSDSISGTTLGGQSFDSGKAQGEKLTETAEGTVKLRSSEAVIIESCRHAGP